MEIKGRKVAVLAEELYEDQELWYPYYRLKEAGAEVKVIGACFSPETVKSKHGYPVKIEFKAGQIAAEEFDAVIIPGGYAPDRLRRCPRAIEFVKDIAARGKPVAAICHGPWVAISAGLVKNKKATSFSSIKDDMINAGAKWVDEEVVVDGNLITSRTPDDLPAFMRELIRKLA